jgi:hypothetical protein
MSTFTRTELRELPPADLGDLLRMTRLDNLWEAAMALGLDPTNPFDRKATETAWETVGYEPDPYSPPVGAGQTGVSADLTPVVPGVPTPVHAEAVAVARVLGDAAPADLELPEPDPEAADYLRVLMAESVDSGKPFVAGTFAAYADPSGAVILVTEDKDGVVTRAILPRRIVKIGIGLISGERRGLAGLIARKLGRG